MTATEIQSERTRIYRRYEKLAWHVADLRHPFMGLSRHEARDELTHRLGVICCEWHGSGRRYRAYDPAKARESTWVTSLLYSDVKEIGRGKAKVRHQPLRSVPSPRPRFDVEKFKSELSDDAGRVIDLVIAEGRRDRRNIRTELHRRKWSRERIIRVFAEVQQAIGDHAAAKTPKFTAEREL